MAKRLTIGEFINKARHVHGNQYDYSKVDYVNNRTKVCIICPEHGEFWQTPDNHINQGHGCPICGGTEKLTEDVFIEKAREIHGDSYDYSRVVYKNNKTKVEILCPKHGSFWQIPNNHLRGAVCPVCGREHGVIVRRRNCYKNFGVYNNMQLSSCMRKVIDTKKKNNTINVSFLQINLRNCLFDFFNRSDVEYEYNGDERYPFNCDFYVKSQNLFIELNGHWTHNDHWFDGNNEDDIKQLEGWLKKSKGSKFYKNAIDVWTIRDLEKREYARKNNLNYVVFWDGNQNSSGLTNEIEQWFSEGCPIRKDWK